MEILVARQSEIINNFTSTRINFNKDSDSRKTTEYLRKRLGAIDILWGEFEQNHNKILEHKDEAFDYFTDNIYQKGKDHYQTVRDLITAYGKSDKSTQPDGKLDELISLQRTNFRAFTRLVKGIKIDQISDIWELEDELKNIQSKWTMIDAQHLQIDHILAGGDITYDEEFSKHELAYKNIKRELHKKISSTSHLERSTPHIDIPSFSGNYTQWPTFYDLFTETIHNNNSITKAQKMQHLKGKLRGEAERLIYHLHISSENYDTAWDILLHRYNNAQLLFTNHIEIFLNQPNIQRQTSSDIKRLYDTSTECIHAIHNLGVDTNTWDPLLVHLLCKKLDPDTYAGYKEARRKPRDLPKLEELMSFLETKFTALEPININKEPSSLSKRNPNQSHNKQNNYKSFTSKNYQAIITQTSKCTVCNLNHARNLLSCKKFMNMTSEVQLKLVSKSNICRNCLFSHDENPCTSTKRCKSCQGDHHTILHEACVSSSTSVPQTTSSSSSAMTASSSEFSKKYPNANHVAGDDEELLLTTLSINVKCSDGSYVTLRALLDQGSQISLISENTVQRLGLQRQRYNASVSGIGAGARQSKGRVSIDCQSIYGDYHFTTEALVLSKVANCLPNAPFKKQSWPHIQHLQLADPEYNVAKPIDILLDVSIYSQIIMDGLIKGPAQAPIAQQTALGWILSGNVRTFNCHIATNDLSDLSKYWEIEDVEASSPAFTSEEQYCEEFYQQNTRRLDTGRYEVGIPMKPEYENQLGLSKSKAIAQFKQLERKMCNNKLFAENYKLFISEYQQLGHMCRANNVEELKRAFFLPHHGVIKLDSTTTKLRVVFNASAKSTSGKSLNDLMCCGPNLQKDLMTLILTWRTYSYVITADIEKMFRQIYIRPSDRHLQSIIWRQSSQKVLNEYNLSTVTYGTKAAPYLAMRTLKQLAIDDADKYPLAAPAVSQSFYMDDLFSGANTIHQAKELQHQLIEMLKGAGMNLRKWSSNVPDLLVDLSPDQLNNPLEFKCSETRKTLGLRWNSSTDSFSFQNQLDHNNKRVTKRQLLSEISKLFDPLGWLSPLSIRAKLLFQNAWTSHLSWDEEVPQPIQDNWIQFKNDFNFIDQFIIPRYLGNTNQSYQIHGFCDASEKAYACAVYVVTKNNKGESTSTLAVAKTKLAPRAKKVSLPRLELCSGLLLSQLIKKVMESLSNQDVEIYAWTDSMIVLGWIQGDVKKWKQFVANRINKIISIIPSSSWHHVRSEQNAADCATRGLTSRQLSSHPLWWQGPKWIINFEQSTLPITSYQSPDLETKKLNVNTALYQNHISMIQEFLQNYSSLTRIVKILAWISRFITQSRRKTTSKTAVLTSSEMDYALNIIIKDDQLKQFQEDILFINQKGHAHPRSKISCLNPSMDEHGILRVGGRLKNASINDSSKHPIILSSHSRLTDLIIGQAHITTLHGGPRLTLSYIRDRYWIISGIRTVKRKLRSCVKCQRFSQTKYHQIMADLPQPRVTPSRPFTHTGVDFTGHVELKANKGRGIKTVKGYVAVFVCLATKAVHLELVSDLSTPAFLAAFRRFSARRGTPCHVYSDNGTNFVGANRIIKKEYQDIIATINTDFFNNINDMNIRWHFNAPAWPSAGGLWEAAVKSLKYHLKRIIGDQKLTYEEFTTLLYQIEACLNSRPLCQLTESPEDDVLTPGHFLIGGPLLSRPQTDPDHINHSTRWQLIQSMNKQLWKRWSSEYLQQLQARSKWRKASRNYEIDDVVLIKDENLPPGKWALGRIQAVHPGKDGYVRVVSIKTKNGTIQRPVSRLVLLPVNEDTTQDQTQDPKTKQS